MACPIHANRLRARLLAGVRSARPGERNHDCTTTPEAGFCAPLLLHHIRPSHRSAAKAPVVSGRVI